MKTLKLEVPGTTKSVFVQTTELLLDTWISTNLLDLSEKDTHDLHFTVTGDDNILQCIAYLLVPGHRPDSMIADTKNVVEMFIRECDDPAFEETTAGDFVYTNPDEPLNTDPVYDYRECNPDNWQVYKEYRADGEDYEDVLATVDTETLAKGVVALLEGTGTVARLTYLIDMLLRQVSEYSENEIIGPDGTDFAMSLKEIEQEVGIERPVKKAYIAKFSKSFYRNGEVTVGAYSEAEATILVDNMLEDLEGSLQYFPEENTIELEEVDQY